MPTFDILVKGEGDSYKIVTRGLEQTNRTKAADQFYAENRDHENDEILVINAAQAESFTLARSVSSVNSKPKQRRKRKNEESDVPQPPDPEDNDGVTAGAQAQSAFGSRTADPAGPLNELKDPNDPGAQGPDPAVNPDGGDEDEGEDQGEGIKGFRKKPE